MGGNDGYECDFRAFFAGTGAVVIFSKEVSECGWAGEGGSSERRCGKY